MDPCTCDKDNALAPSFDAMSQLRRSARVAGQAVAAPKRKATASGAAAKKAKTEKISASADTPVTDATEEAKHGLAGKKGVKVDDDKAAARGAPTTTTAKELEVGDAIPDLTLVDENGADVNLAAAAQKSKYVVIFAYPKASTPGCTRQAKGFQKNHQSLASLDAVVYGLLADVPKSQLNFVTKQGLQYHLLSDPGRALIGALGARKSPTGIKRSHWIFADGKLAVKRVQISPEASIDGALAEVQKLAKGE